MERRDFLKLLGLGGLGPFLPKWSTASHRPTPKPVHLKYPVVALESNNGHRHVLFDWEVQATWHEAVFRNLPMLAEVVLEGEISGIPRDLQGGDQVQVVRQKQRGWESVGPAVINDMILSASESDVRCRFHARFLYALGTPEEHMMRPYRMLA